MHPSQIEQLHRERRWDFERALPDIPPGTTTEAEAIEALDRARAQEQREQSSRGPRPTVSLSR